MLGKPEWFTYRTWGWGIKAKSWQGWVYFGVFIALMVGLGIVPENFGATRIFLKFMIGLFVADSLIMWAQLGGHHDEREQLHQLIIERNCSMVAVVALCAIVLFRSFHNQGVSPAGTFQLDTGSFPFDPLLLFALIAMSLTKLISTLYLRYKK